MKDPDKGKIKRKISEKKIPLAENRNPSTLRKGNRNFPWDTSVTTSMHCATLREMCCVKIRSEIQ